MDSTRQIRLSSIYELAPQTQMEVLAVRNQASVRSMMYTDHIISEAEHEHWLRSCASDASKMVLIATAASSEVVGMVGFSNICRKNHRAEWAFYVSERFRGRGYGPALELRAMEIAFEQLLLEKLNCEVLMTNPRVVSQHLKFGFKNEGIRRAHILRDAQMLDVAMMGITRQEWGSTKDALRTMIGRAAELIA